MPLVLFLLIWRIWPTGMSFTRDLGWKLSVWSRVLAAVGLWKVEVISWPSFLVILRSRNGIEMGWKTYCKSYITIISINSVYKVMQLHLGFPPDHQDVIDISYSGPHQSIKGIGSIDFQIFPHPQMQVCIRGSSWRTHRGAWQLLVISIIELKINSCVERNSTDPGQIHFDATSPSETCLGKTILPCIPIHGVSMCTVIPHRYLQGDSFHLPLYFQVY